MYRYFGEDNSTTPETANLYGLEMYLHETLMQSEHRCGPPTGVDRQCSLSKGTGVGVRKCDDHALGNL